MSNYDPEHPYSEEPTRATPRLDPSALNKPHTQPIDDSSGTREVPYGSPPPDRSYGRVMPRVTAGRRTAPGTSSTTPTAATATTRP